VDVYSHCALNIICSHSFVDGWALNMICIHKALWMFTHIVLWILSAPTALLMVGLWIWFVLTKLCGCLLTLCELWILSIHIELCWWLLILFEHWLLSVPIELCGCLLTLCELWILSIHIELWWWSLTFCGFWIFICTQRALLMVTHIVWALNIMCILRALLMLWAEYFL
jgi:hypothetical protein